MRYLFLIFFIGLTAFAPAQNSLIESYLTELNLDSLKQSVSYLTGLKKVSINGQEQSITSRYRDEIGNEIAGQFLSQELNRMGYTAVSANFSTTGTNIYAIKEGSTFKDQAYFVTAHYDAIAVPFSSAIGADDNASGCAAVLEMARILQNKTLPYSVVFVFFDEEEQGIVGSKAFQNQFDFQKQNIKAVFNLDMIANDRNDDRTMELHTRPFGNSEELAYKVQRLNDTFSIGLNVEIRNPGTTASDHAAFWNEGATAILFIEDAQDFNPYYHTKFDSLHYFNDSFFYQNTKLAFASLLWFGLSDHSKLSTGKVNELHIGLYPNPSNGTIYLDYDGELNYRVLGLDGKIIYESFKAANENSLNLSHLPEGTYILETLSSDAKLGHNLVILQAK